MSKKHPIQKRRERIGISREALADRIGVTSTTLYRWETGRVNPSRAYLRLIESVFEKIEEGDPHEQLPA